MVVEKVFAVIAESTRRDILEALAQDSKAVGQLVEELGVSQPTVSKHLRVLREAGVVTMRAQGQKRFYGINTEPLALVSTWLDSLGAGITETSGASNVASATGTRTEAEDPASANESGVQTLGEAPTAAAPVSTTPAAAASDVRPVAKKPAVADRAGQSAPQAPLDAAGTLTVSLGKPAQAADAVVKAPEPVTTGNDSDGGVPRQLGRSVGRAAKKGADLLATFKRRKD